MSDEGFFGRWARRKQEVKEGREVAAEPPVVDGPRVAPPQPSNEGGVSLEVQPEPTPPPPTLEDAQSLTPESDFKRFVGADVPADVKNTALKKLFADPRFNVQDGLDVYIDDYSRPDPLPPAMLRQLASAQFLDLFGEKKEGREGAYEVDCKTVAQSAPDGQAVPPTGSHADTDLRLQQDDAPGPEGPGECPE